MPFLLLNSVSFVFLLFQNRFTLTNSYSHTQLICDIFKQLIFYVLWNLFYWSPQVHNLASFANFYVHFLHTHTYTHICTDILTVFHIYYLFFYPSRPSFCEPVPNWVQYFSTRLLYKNTHHIHIKDNPAVWQRKSPQLCHQCQQPFYFLCNCSQFRWLFYLAYFFSFTPLYFLFIQHLPFIQQLNVYFNVVHSTIDDQSRMYSLASSGFSVLFFYYQKRLSAAFGITITRKKREPCALYVPHRVDAK